MKMKLVFTLVLFFTLNGHGQTVPMNCQQAVATESQKKYWKHYSNDYKNMMESMGGVFISLLSNEKQFQSQIYWLRQLGFVLETNQFSAPSIDDLIANYDSLMQMVVSKWNKEHPNDLINKDDIIRPAFAQKHKLENKWIYARSASEAPSLYDMEFTSPIYVLGSALYKALSQGLFPLVGGDFFALLEEESSTIETVLNHDIIGHLTSYLEYPKFMKEYRRLTKYIDTDITFKRLFNEEPALFKRIYYFNEGLVLSSSKKIKDNKKLFPYKELDFNNLVNFKLNYIEMSDQLQSKYNPAQLVVLSEEFISKQAEIFLQMGGISRDNNNGLPSSESYNIHFPILSKLIDYTDSEAKGIKSKNTHKELSIRLAKIQWLAIKLAQVDMKTWANMILADVPSQYFIDLFSQDKNNKYNVFELFDLNEAAVLSHATDWVENPKVPDSLW